MNATHDRPSNNPERLAPSVDPTWVRDFVLEQRLRGVPAARIGDALATVESHVAESGEGAADAFGDPVGYARALPAGSEWDLGARAIGEIVLGLVGMLLVTRAFNEWLAGEQVRVITADVITAVILGAMVLTLLLRPVPILRLVAERPLLAYGLFILPVAVFVVTQLLFRTELATLPLVPVAVVGVLALAAASGSAYLNTEADEIVGPGESPRRSAVSRRVGVVLYPLLTAGLMLISWVPTLFV